MTSFNSVTCVLNKIFVTLVINITVVIKNLIIILKIKAFETAVIAKRAVTLIILFLNYLNLIKV